MRLRDLLKSRFARPDDAPETPMPRFSVMFDDDGANFVIAPEHFASLKRGTGQWETQEQYLVLQVLAERGEARVLPNGFEMRSEDVVRLGAEEAEILGLPPRFVGRFETEVRRNTSSRDFAVRVRARVGDYSYEWERKGPRLTVGSHQYTLSAPALRALAAVEEHGRLHREERTEDRNVTLVAELQAANALASEGPEGLRDETFHLDLGHLRSFDTVVPDSVGLVVEKGDDGSLKVTPDLGVDVQADKLDRRWHQLQGATSGGVLRVDNQLILLKEKQLAGVQHVLGNRRIPSHQVDTFLKAPGAFFDPELVDVELRFGVRVKGVGVVVPQTFAEASGSGIDWFDEVAAPLPATALAELATDLAEHEELEEKVGQAREAGARVVAVDDGIVDISDEPAVAAALEASRERLTASVRDDDPAQRDAAAVQVGVVIEDASTAQDARERADTARPQHPVDYAGLARRPYPHQREGIEWLVGLMHASLEGADGSPGRVQGAILADDMGLGKTFMTLVALREFMAAERARGDEPRPTLAVLPVALIENWEEEITKTFHENPYDDVVVLQGGRDLPRFRLRGAPRETVASASRLDEEGMLTEDAIRLSLRVGETYGDARLDVPGRLVLTTYDALRSYQLSLAQVDWGVVVFDEAQYIKNPDTLTTRAAKGLKARFKLLATGTPIENKLLDFWCLMDTAQPGLLGTWAEFRSEWVNTIDNAEGEEKVRLGRRLRELVGPFMLRRVKEDHLHDLPAKTIYTPVPGSDGAVLLEDLGVRMPPVQQSAYDQHLQAYKARARRTPSAALETVQALRAVSLHPKAQGTESITTDLSGLDESARLQGTIRILDRIRDAGEKAIVFVIAQKVQRNLALWLRARYGIPVSIVNGDTNAVSKGGGATRRSLIREFEAHGGFNVIIMSPLAVGVGLTVVGANHAIHLERHWNPAKEAQATDRIYRIGQTRPVHVYLPMALHPQFPSFDVNLDRLLRQKTDLKDVVMVPESVKDDELAASMGLLE